MKKAQKKRRAGLSGTLSKGLVAVLAVYLVGTLIYNQVQITAKRQELSDVQEQITQKQQENEELKRLIGDGSGNDDAIIERAARDDLGYAFGWANACLRAGGVHTRQKGVSCIAV